MGFRVRDIVSFAAIFAAAQAAYADGAHSSGFIEEVRLGIMQHNVCVTDCKNADKEDGPNINAEIVFGSPEFLDILFGPRPFVLASFNTAGNTSFGGFGLNWDVKLSEKFSIEPSFGYVIHDGALEAPFPQGDPRNVEFSEENVLLGSEDLFRSAISLERKLTPKVSAQLTFEHLSHGQILGSGRNQSMNNIGVRVAYSF